MQSRSVVSGGALGVALLLAASAASAQSFTGGGAGVIYQTNGLPLTPLANNDHTLCLAQGGVSGSCGLTGASFDGFAKLAPNGVMHAHALTSASGLDVTLQSSPANVTAVGLGTFGFVDVINDTITFTGAQPDHVTFSYLVDGWEWTTGATGAATLTPDVSIAFGSSFGSNAPLNSFIYDSSFSSNGVVNQPVQASGSTSVALNGHSSLTFSIQFATGALITSPDGTGLNGTVVSDFSNTAGFGVQAFDANGNDITTAAGLTFNGAALPNTPGVPEPATWAMLLAGIGGLGGAARLRRSAPLRATS
jgi:hypothetical protein